MQLLDIIHNDILLVALIAWATAQFIKVVINAIVHKTINFERLFGDGGMPSGHSATVTALALMVGLKEGFASPLFAISFILAVIVMHDASGVRREAGKHAVALIEMAQILNQYIEYLSESDHKVKTEKLKTLIGHTNLQVLFGALTGIVVVVLYYLIV